MSDARLPSELSERDGRVTVNDIDAEYARIPLFQVRVRFLRRNKNISDGELTYYFQIIVTENFLLFKSACYSSPLAKGIRNEVR